MKYGHIGEQNGLVLSKGSGSGQPLARLNANLALHSPPFNVVQNLITNQNVSQVSVTPLISILCKTEIHIKIFLRALLVSALPALAALLCTSCTTSHQVVEYT